MENASKALLIAAGVLIVILLIAFGMLIFNSAGDTSSDAQEVGQSIAEQSSTAASHLKDILGQTGSNKEKVKLINFTISGISYKAKEGMTWKEWVDNKEYSLNKFTAYIGHIEYSASDYDGNVILRKNNDTGQNEKPSDVIISGHAYVLLGC